MGWQHKTMSYKGPGRQRVATQAGCRVVGWWRAGGGLSWSTERGEKFTNVIQRPCRAVREPGC